LDLALHLRRDRHAETKRRRFGTHPVDDCPAGFM
jgi:hypothetical protein